MRTNPGCLIVVSALCLAGCASAPSRAVHRRIASAEPTYHYSETQLSVQEMIQKAFHLDSWVFITGEDGSGQSLGAVTGIVTESQVQCIQLQISELREVFQDKAILKFVQTKGSRINIHLNSENLPESTKAEADFSNGEDSKENLYLWPLVDTVNTGTLHCQVNPAASIRAKIYEKYDEIPSPAESPAASELKRVRIRY